MEEEDYYLQSGFDPNSLTMPQIRSALLKHGIDYPTGNVKKAKLVEIFETELAPQAATILSKAGKTKASSRGIINAEDYGTIGEPEVAPTPRRRGAARRGKAASVASHATDDDGTTGDEEMVATIRKSVRSTPKKRTASPIKRGRPPSAQPKQDSDEEEPLPVETPKPRRGRKSLAAKTPEPVKVPSPEPEPSPSPVVEEEESNFSSHNPFQMGSSPRYEPSADKDRRQTLPNKHTPRKTDGSRRKTEGLFSARKTPGFEEPEDLVYRKTKSPTPSNFTAIPISRFKSLTPEVNRVQHQLDHQQDQIARRMNGDEITIKEEDESFLEPGEEFVPDEQLEVELEDERANAVEAYARKRVKSAGSPVLFNLFYVMFFVVLAGFGAIWRQDKLEVGYCGIGSESKLESQLPEFLNTLVPSCEECPINAQCGQNMETKCHTDFVLVPHPYSFWGLVPFAPTCQPDSEKVRRVSVLLDAMVGKLRDRAAAVECGHVKVGKDEEPGLAENTLRKDLISRKSGTISESQFNDLWTNAVTELEKKDEVIINVTSGGERFFLSTNLSHIGLSCALRKNTASLLLRYKLELFGIILLITTLWKGKAMMEQRTIYRRQVQRLVALALKRLAKQQYDYYKANTATAPYIPVNQLRDSILSREFNPTKRQELWAGVSKVVELNSNVRTNQMEVMGEVMRCWTWIGSYSLLEAGEPEERDSQKDETELRRIMGEGDTRNDLVQPRNENVPRVLY